MRHLVKLADLAPGQEEEIVALLERRGIAHRVTPAGVLLQGRILVAEDRYAEAKALLREESEAFAAKARAQWSTEWQTEHGGSAWRWFMNRLRADPAGTFVKLLALVAMVAIFVVYPGVIIFRWLVAPA